MNSDWSHYRLSTHCPRCGGNVFLEKDLFGWIIDCLQCGYEQDVEIRNRTVVVVVYKPIQNLTKNKKVLV